jgi:hypothetical protein
MAKTKQPAQVYQLKITLRHIKPPVWRRVQVKDCTLAHLHEGKVKISRLLAGGIKKWNYVYDMGDSWEHLIQAEKVVDAEPGVRYPRCIAGKRACPPEDCGGPWGYGDFLETIQDPKHERHEELLEWVGGEFDPEAFDVEAVNEELR